MDNIYDLLLLNIDLLLLILIRVTGIFVIAPVFGRNNLPMTMKVGISLLMAFILLPILSTSASIHYSNFIELAIYSVNEFLIGIIIGFIGFLYFSTLYLAGTIIDTQMGFSMVNVLDPQTNTQMPIMGNYYNILFTLLFLLFDGHHFLIRALVYSYDMLPVGVAFTIGEEGIYGLTLILMEVFILAFRFSAPVLATIFLANVLLGILARTMPQMNVFIVGMPLKVMVGLLTVLITLQFIVPFSERLFDSMFHSLQVFIDIISRG
ncbi:flagellar biosynthetic protein FliR [Clostridium formicaceticum]|uniref:Flagellar biosynthetic protein FliR n=1 Tax=Clostridium formicaceticum TaxID=1497 RepID=A0AAC9RIS6_9CLOT|nr:flagellar biosynthetic protein FliR [Clostridium formicaceticum]AOY77303.1 flagellar biosynthetic protein FliR [Clostridium formicaceticum]ARE87846.1 Flagellar biosynthetic protein FliR [Clostridium formicaceticum]